MGRNIDLPAMMKSMQLVSSRKNLNLLEERMSSLPATVPKLISRSGKVLFNRSQPVQQQPMLRSDSNEELNDIIFASGGKPPYKANGGAVLSASPISRIGQGLSDNPRRREEPLDSDNDSLDSVEKLSDDKFQKLMRVQSFGEMPLQMEGIFHSLASSPGLSNQQLQEEFMSPPEKSNGSVGAARRRRSGRNKRDQNGDSGAARLNQMSNSPKTENSSYVPSWQSPNSSGVVSNDGNDNKSTKGGGGNNKVIRAKNSKTKNYSYSKNKNEEEGDEFSTIGELPSANASQAVGVSEKYNERSSASLREDSLSPEKREDPLEVVKRRQASRRAARRALSASNADERRPRNQPNDEDKDDPIHGPGTPFPVGKYSGDGSRTNIETVDVIARRDMRKSQQDKPSESEAFDENRPLAGGGVYNLDFMDDSDANANANAGSPEVYGGAVKNKPLKVSLATRRRQERQKLHPIAGSPVKKSSIRKKPRASPPRRTTNHSDTEFGAEGNNKWATATADVRTTITFGGEEHVSSSLRAEAHEYMTTDDIRPSPNPQQELQRVLTKIEIEEWPEIFHTLNSVRRLALHHSQILGGHVHSVLRSVLKAVDNLRSAVAKNAILTIGDMWLGLGRTMDPELNLVAPALLKRFADTNGFLCEVADGCIDTVISNASDNRCLSAFLSSAGNKAPSVRAKAAAVVLRCIQRTDPSKLATSRELEKLLATLAQFCQDRQGETRNFGRQIAVTILQNNVVDESRLQKVLPKDVYAKVEQGMRNGVFTTPSKRLSATGGSGGLDDEEVDIFEVSGSNLNFASFGPGGGSGGDGGGGGAEGVASTPVHSRGFKSVGRREARSSPGHVSTALSPQYVEFEGMPDIFKKMRSTDWKDRQEGVSEIVSLVQKHPGKVVSSGKLVPILDRLCEKLSDGNTKVNVMALEGVAKCLESLGDAVGAALGVLVPALCANLARTPKLNALARSTIDMLTQSIDPKLLCQPFCDQVEHGNGRIKSFMLAKLSEIAPRIFQTSSEKAATKALTKNIIPLLVKCVNDNKPDVKQSCTSLAVTLYSLMGDSLVQLCNKLNDGVGNKIESILGL